MMTTTPKAREWILVEHGRWTRGCKIDNGEKELVIRMIEAESISAYLARKTPDVSMAND